MADRTVKVVLRLERDDYKRGLREAAADTRGFDAEVRAAGTSLARTGVEVKATGTQVEAMGRQVDTAAKKTTGLGTETEKTKRQTTGLGDESDKTRGKLTNLTGEIDKAKAALAAMGDEFRRTGELDAAGFKQTTARLKELERLRDDIAKQPVRRDKSSSGLLDFALDEWITRSVKSSAGAITDAGKEAGKLFGSGMQGTLSTPVIGPMIGLALVGAVVAAAPVVMAAAAAAVNAGFGGGVLALGISRAVADERVANAWSSLGDVAVRELDKSSGRFVEPLIRSAREFEVVLTGDVMPSVDRAMAALAPSIDRLTDGAVGFLRNIGPGFDDLAASAGPFVDLLAEHLPELGDALASFMGHLSNAGPGAYMFFDDLLTLTEQSIRILGWLVEKGAALYETFSALGFLLQGDFGNAAGAAGDGLKHLFTAGGDGKAALDGVKEGAEGVVPPLAEVATVVGRIEGSFRDAIREAEFFISTLDRVNGGNIALAQAQIGAQSSLDRFKEALKDSNGNLDITTEKGRNARQSAVDLALAIGDVAQKTYEQSGSSQQGAQALAGLRESMINTAVQSGMTRQAAEDLITTYLRVPDDVSTPVSAPGIGEARESMRGFAREADTADQKSVATPVSAPGLSEARAGLAGHSRDLDNLNGKTATTYTNNVVTTIYRESGAPSRGFSRLPAERWGGLYEHAAVGKLRDASVYGTANPGRYMIAEPETGGEAFVPKFGDYDRSMSILNHAASWYGAQVVPAGGGGGTANIRLTLSADGGGMPFEQAMSSYVMYAIRTGQIQLKVDGGGTVRVGR